MKSLRQQQKFHERAKTTPGVGAWRGQAAKEPQFPSVGYQGDTGQAQVAVG